MIIKGYSNKMHLEHPSSYGWGFIAGNPLCTSPLALQVPSGKGARRLIAFCRIENGLPDRFLCAIICIRSRRVTRWWASLNLKKRGGGGYEYI